MAIYSSSGRKKSGTAEQERNSQHGRQWLNQTASGLMLFAWALALNAILQSLALRK
jgi:hypothetical protein